jgi:hypothetical protein
MAIDEQGVVWVISDASFNLYQIDPSDAHCTQTSYQPPQALMNTGGIGFAAKAPGSLAGVLYLSAFQSLYQIDPQTLQTTTIGSFQPLPSPSLTDGPSLAGTRDGRLFALWLGAPTLAEVDPSSAQVLWSMPVPTTASKAYAVAAWSGALWIFTLPTAAGSIVRYDLATKTMTHVMATGTAPVVLSAAAPPACSP